MLLDRERGLGVGGGSRRGQRGGGLLNWKRAKKLFSSSAIEVSAVVDIDGLLL